MTRWLRRLYMWRAPSVTFPVGVTELPGPIRVKGRVIIRGNQ